MCPNCGYHCGLQIPCMSPSVHTSYLYSAQSDHIPIVCLQRNENMRGRINLIQVPLHSDVSQHATDEVLFALHV